MISGGLGGGMKKISLRSIYLFMLTVVFLISFLAFVLFDLNSQKQQAEAALLEESRTFAREMGAVWTFMDNSQKVINTSADGDYDFKRLHCSIVGKSVGAIFSSGSDYKIRYTNFNPRSIQDKPDEYEATALAIFNEDSSVTEHYGIAEYQGKENFRYLQALDVDQSCLECHGLPQGEIDITGHAKEGWTLDSVGGAISIVIPLDQQNKAIQNNVMRDALFFLILALLIGSIIYLVTTLFVLHPLKRMGLAFEKMGEGKLQIKVKDVHSAKEVSGIIGGFNDMASELHTMYSNLERQVASRTYDLQQANEVLERQKSDLEVLSEKLAKEAQFKSDLLSMVNHELRTPLTSIITLAQISQSSDVTDNQSSWDEIERNSQILLEMINNMLDIARTDANAMQAVREPVDLGDVVTSVCSTMVPLADRYCVSFIAYVDPNVPLVIGDEDKIQRMLENLGSNAIKFTPDGGEVRLDVSLDERSGDILLQTRDTGIGISQEDQRRIFDRFFQVDSTSTRKYNGSGLGLTLVKEHADLQGFDVSVKSSLGVGSVFTVRIPACYGIGEE
jgi:two-component system sensor histidine kinase BarA